MCGVRIGLNISAAALHVAPASTTPPATYRLRSHPGSRRERAAKAGPRPQPGLARNRRLRHRPAARPGEGAAALAGLTLTLPREGVPTCRLHATRYVR